MTSMKLHFFQDLLPHPQNSTVSQVCTTSIYKVQTAITVVSAMDVLNCKHTAASNSTISVLFMIMSPSLMVIMADSHLDLIA